MTGQSDVGVNYEKFIGMKSVTRRAYYEWQEVRSIVSSLTAMIDMMITQEQKRLDVFWGLRLHELKTMPYKEYLLTPEWQQIRKRSLMIADNKCQICEATGVELHVHHKTYERRGEELPEDLIVLCKDCHTNIHEKETA